MSRLKTWLCVCLLAFGAPQISSAEQAGSIEEATAGLTHLDGFIDLFWDQDKGRLLLRVDDMESEFIYQSSLARGVGSNDLGLDRGQLGATRLVEFYRSGPKVLMMEINTAYRARSDDPAEQAAVEQSFARSVVWGFEVIAETGESVLLDATGFFLRDAHGIASRLSRAKQGKYSVAAERSAIYLPRTRAFPDNTEIEAIVTYTGEPDYDDRGRPLSPHLSSVTPDPTSLAVHLHHSLIRLPEPGFEPLPYDPRTGIIGTSGGEGFVDYAADIGVPVRVRHGRRHRLEKKHPTAPLSEAVEPIVYYLDPGAPEPVRSALLEGASWWNQAFEAAGYKDAFQVRMLPADADPMDVRYNVIQWVHRSTRGWSYGSSVVDPRNGEILKGHVTLGSLRVRQDYLIAEGLLAPYGEGRNTDGMLEMSLARLRQLSAHEVGHTLGFEHNFAASVNGRSSVMDYPFPLIRFTPGGDLDLSDAYGVGIGEWDKRTVLYAYQDFPDGADAREQRDRILRETMDSGLLYVADQDARDPGSAHPHGNLWDNGADAVAELDHLMRVRAYALERFSAANLKPGTPLAELEEVLVPVYLLHRYQIQAVAKLVGGSYFNYALKGDGQAPPSPVAAARQSAAVEALLGTLEPSQLKLPQALVGRIPPRPPGYGLGRETFSRSTGNTFDPLAPAASAIGLVLESLLHPRRAARMNVLHAADRAYPGFGAVLDALLRNSWYQARSDGIEAAIQRLKNTQVMNALMTLASEASATSHVRAQAALSIETLQRWLEKQRPGRLDGDWRAHYASMEMEIEQWLERPAGDLPASRYPAPPGSPIGG